MNVALVQHAGGSNPAPIVAWQCWQVVTVTVTVLLVAARVMAARGPVEQLGLGALDRDCRTRSVTVMVMVGSIRLAASASVSRK